MKKLKKVSIILALVFALLIFTVKSVMAAPTSVYFKLYNAIGRPTGYYFVSTQTGAYKPDIKIVKASSSGVPEQETNDTAYYCLKNGIGFGAADSRAIDTIEYTQYFDMKNPNAINEPYRSALPTDEATYNKVMWLLENFCIPQDENSKKILLKAAGLSEDAFDKYNVSGKEQADVQKDIIEAIQQAAIWHYTNPSGEFHVTDSPVFQYAASANGTKMELEKLSSKQDLADSPIDDLYEYLITGAENAVKAGYTYTTASQANPISFDKSNATVSTTSDYFLVGPYKLNVKGSTITTFNATITDGTNTLSDVTILGEDKKTPLNGNSVNEKISNGLNKNFYIAVPLNTSAPSITINVSSSYTATSETFYSTSANTINSQQPVVQIKKIVNKDEVTDTKQIAKPSFDLALRKYITKLNGEDLEVSREPKYTQEYLKQLATETGTTIEKTTLVKEHTKNPVSVKKGDKVLYTIRIYNEGQVDGIASEITDYLPSGLKLVENSQINSQYNWKMYDKDGKETTDYTKCSYIKSDALKDKKIKAFNVAPANGVYEISSDYVQVECEVIEDTGTTDKHLKNIAEITKSNNDQNLSDRDSKPDDLNDSQKSNYEPGTSEKGKGYEDDDDYEDLVVPGRYFDLALRKFISKINDKSYDRAPVVDVTPLLSGSTTASYKHIKSPVSVEAGDYVIYTIRVYNEGQVDGYVDEIVDHLPPELEFVNDDFNAENGWVLDTSDTTQRTIKTTKLSKENDKDNIIKAFNQQTKEISYKELYVKCLVKKTAPTQKVITNIAEITKSSNEYNLVDRDNKANATLPSDNDLPNYKGNSNNKSDLTDKDYHYEGQEDDDDFEKIILEKFDLALRKFITGVNNEEITSRIPQVDKSKFGTIVDGKEVTTCTYNHTKDPVRVAQNDVVTYTIRIYNEGTKAGYAAVVKDDIPDGLEFLPDNETNKTYRWKLFDENMNETSDVSKAKYISTDYLSKEQEKEAGSNLLKAFDAGTMDEPDHRDVKVAFKVTEPNTSDRIIINKAQISKHTDEKGETPNDVDSVPDKWNDGEDDQDIEKIYVKYFDLSLRKWVTQAIVIEDGEEKVMETGHYAEQDPEPVVKVEINKKRLNDTVIKFRYSIRVKNEGEIEGYATEISDYIPNGLKFNQADNPKWKEVNGKITTDQLKDTLLKPGDTATVDVLLTWVNSEDNMGVMTNVAEISKDKNDSNTKDIDSTPNNKKSGEDDIDDAPVALTVVAGSKPTYIILISSILAIIGASVFVIKKYVL